jgi:hypothetical protein
MKAKAEIVNVPIEQWREMWANCIDCSVSIDQKNHEWIIREAQANFKRVFKSGNRYLVIYA